MFLGIFETFVGLLSLYTGTLGSTNNYLYMNSSKISTGEHAAPPQNIGNPYCSAFCGSCVRFTFDMDSYDYIYDEGEDYYTESTYNIYSSVGNNYNSIGSFSFRLEVDEITNYFRISTRYTFDDVYNLKVNIHYYMTSDLLIDEQLFVDLRNDYYSDQYFYYTPYIGESITDFFDNNDGYIFLDIETVPISQEEWFGYYDAGYTDGYDNGYAEGNANGYINGYNDAIENGSTASVIFSGILSIALVPVNFFLGILNFEVFGINIGAFVSALLTVAIVIIVTRIIFNGGNGSGDSK